MKNSLNDATPLAVFARQTDGEDERQKSLRVVFSYVRKDTFGGGADALVGTEQKFERIIHANVRDGIPLSTTNQDSSVNTVLQQVGEQSASPSATKRKAESMKFAQNSGEYGGLGGE